MFYLGKMREHVRRHLSDSYDEMADEFKQTHSSSDEQVDELEGRLQALEPRDFNDNGVQQIDATELNIRLEAYKPDQQDGDVSGSFQSGIEVREMFRAGAADDGDIQIVVANQTTSLLGSTPPSYNNAQDTGVDIIHLRDLLLKTPSGQYGAVLGVAKQLGVLEEVLEAWLSNTAEAGWSKIEAPVKKRGMSTKCFTDLCARVRSAQVDEDNDNEERGILTDALPIKQESPKKTLLARLYQKVTAPVRAVQDVFSLQAIMMHWDGKQLKTAGPEVLRSCGNAKDIVNWFIVNGVDAALASIAGSLIGTAYQYSKEQAGDKYIEHVLQVALPVLKEAAAVASVYRLMLLISEIALPVATVFMAASTVYDIASYCYQLDQGRNIKPTKEKASRSQLIEKVTNRDVDGSWIKPDPSLILKAIFTAPLGIFMAVSAYHLHAKQCDYAYDPSNPLGLPQSISDQLQQDACDGRNLDNLLGKAVLPLAVSGAVYYGVKTFLQLVFNCVAAHSAKNTIRNGKIQARVLQYDFNVGRGEVVARKFSYQRPGRIPEFWRKIAPLLGAKAYHYYARDLDNKKITRYFLARKKPGLQQKTNIEGGALYFIRQKNKASSDSLPTLDEDGALYSIREKNKASSDSLPTFNKDAANVHLYFWKSGKVQSVNLDKSTIRGFADPLYSRLQNIFDQMVKDEVYEKELTNNDNAALLAMRFINDELRTHPNIAIRKQVSPVGKIYSVFKPFSVNDVLDTGFFVMSGTMFLIYQASKNLQLFSDEFFNTPGAQAYANSTLVDSGLFENFARAYSRDHAALIVAYVMLGVGPLWFLGSATLSAFAAYMQVKTSTQMAKVVPKGRFLGGRCLDPKTLRFKLPRPIKAATHLVVPVAITAAAWMISLNILKARRATCSDNTGIFSPYYMQAPTCAMKLLQEGVQPFRDITFLVIGGKLVFNFVTTPLVRILEFIVQRLSGAPSVTIMRMRIDSSDKVAALQPMSEGTYDSEEEEGYDTVDSSEDNEMSQIKNPTSVSQAPLDNSILVVVNNNGGEMSPPNSPLSSPQTLFFAKQSSSTVSPVNENENKDEDKDKDEDEDLTNLTNG